MIKNKVTRSIQCSVLNLKYTEYFVLLLRRIKVHIKHVHCNKSWAKEVQITTNTTTTDIQFKLALWNLFEGLNLELCPVFVLCSSWGKSWNKSVVYVCCLQQPHCCCSLFDLGRSACPRKDLHWEHRERLVLECDTRKRKHAAAEWRLLKVRLKGCLFKPSDWMGTYGQAKWRSYTLPNLNSSRTQLFTGKN